MEPEAMLYQGILFVIFGLALTIATLRQSDLTSFQRGGRLGLGISSIVGGTGQALGVMPVAYVGVGLLFATIAWASYHRLKDDTDAPLS